uniref:Uncharacterized protein n=1 Tax=Picea glauca TaxID=3330 RepID=A0A124GP06_PICGL|nr:hypothetical protein ABT39_MTgene264 [Picea glauca]
MEWLNHLSLHMPGFFYFYLSIPVPKEGGRPRTDSCRISWSPAHLPCIPASIRTIFSFDSCSSRPKLLYIPPTLDVYIPPDPG